MSRNLARQQGNILEKIQALELEFPERNPARVDSVDPQIALLRERVEFLHNQSKEVSQLLREHINNEHLAKQEENDNKPERKHNNLPIAFPLCRYSDLKAEDQKRIVKPHDLYLYVSARELAHARIERRDGSSSSNRL